MSIQRINCLSAAPFTYREFCGKSSRPLTQKRFEQMELPNLEAASKRHTEVSSICINLLKAIGEELLHSCFFQKNTENRRPIYFDDLFVRNLETGTRDRVEQITCKLRERQGNARLTNSSWQVLQKRIDFPDVVEYSSIAHVHPLVICKPTQVLSQELKELVDEAEEFLLSRLYSEDLMIKEIPPWRAREGGFFAIWTHTFESRLISVIGGLVAFHWLRENNELLALYIESQTLPKPIATRDPKHRALIHEERIQQRLHLAIAASVSTYLKKPEYFFNQAIESTLKLVSKDIDPEDKKVLVHLVSSAVKASIEILISKYRTGEFDHKIWKTLLQSLGVNFFLKAAIAWKEKDAGETISDKTRAILDHASRIALSSWQTWNYQDYKYVSSTVLSEGLQFVYTCAMKVLQRADLSKRPDGQWESPLARWGSRILGALTTDSTINSLLTEKAVEHLKERFPFAKDIEETQKREQEILAKQKEEVSKFVAQIEEAFSLFQGQIPKQTEQDIQAKIALVKKALERADTAAIQTALNDLVASFEVFRVAAQEAHEKAPPPAIEPKPAIQEGGEKHLDDLVLEASHEKSTDPTELGEEFVVIETIQEESPETTATNIPSQSEDPQGTPPGSRELEEQQRRQLGLPNLPQPTRDYVKAIELKKNKKINKVHVVGTTSELPNEKLADEMIVLYKQKDLDDYQFSQKIQSIDDQANAQGIPVSQRPKIPKLVRYHYVVNKSAGPGDATVYRDNQEIYRQDGKHLGNTAVEVVRTCMRKDRDDNEKLVNNFRSSLGLIPSPDSVLLPPQVTARKYNKESYTNRYVVSTPDSLIGKFDNPDAANMIARVVARHYAEMCDLERQRLFAQKQLFDLGVPTRDFPNLPPIEALHITEKSPEKIHIQIGMTGKHNREATKDYVSETNKVALKFNPSNPMIIQPPAMTREEKTAVKRALSPKNLKPDKTHGVFFHLWRTPEKVVQWLVDHGATSMVCRTPRIPLYPAPQASSSYVETQHESFRQQQVMQPVEPSNIARNQTQLVPHQPFDINNPAQNPAWQGHFRKWELVQSMRGSWDGDVIESSIWVDTRVLGTAIRKDDEQCGGAVVNWTKRLVEEWTTDLLQARKDMDLSVIRGIAQTAAFVLKIAVMNKKDCDTIDRVSGTVDRYFTTAVGINPDSPSSDIGEFVGTLLLKSPSALTRTQSGKVALKLVLKISSKCITTDPGKMAEVESVDARSGAIVREHFEHLDTVNNPPDSDSLLMKIYFYN